MASDQDKLRVGFLSTAGIGHKNHLAITRSTSCDVHVSARVHPSHACGRSRASGSIANAYAGKHIERSSQNRSRAPVVRLTPVCRLRCQGVASRSEEKARAWADERGVGAAYGTYDAMLGDDAVQAVYNPLPTALRSAWSVKIAKAGKHVLSEKPAAASLDELDRVLAACEEAGVAWMDGVMFQHHARLQRMAEVFGDAEAFGPVRRVSTQFSFFASDDFLASDIRFKPSMEPAGCVGDLGWYSIRFSLYAFGYSMPEAVECKVHRRVGGAEGVEGAPIDATGTLHFAGGGIAVFDTSNRASFRQSAEIVGTKGRVTLDDFCIADSAEEVSFTVEREAGLKMPDMDATSTKRETHTVHGCRQETQMWETFSRIARGGEAAAEERKFYVELTRKTQSVLDAALESARRDGTRLTLQADGLRYA